MMILGWGCWRRGRRGEEVERRRRGPWPVGERRRRRAEELEEEVWREERKSAGSCCCCCCCCSYLYSSFLTVQFLVPDLERMSKDEKETIR